MINAGVKMERLTSASNLFRSVNNDYQSSFRSRTEFSEKKQQLDFLRTQLNQKREEQSELLAQQITVINENEALQARIDLLRSQIEPLKNEAAGLQNRCDTITEYHENLNRELVQTHNKFLMSLLTFGLSKVVTVCSKAFVEETELGKTVLDQAKQLVENVQGQLGINPVRLNEGHLSKGADVVGMTASKILRIKNQLEESSTNNRNWVRFQGNIIIVKLREPLDTDTSNYDDLLNLCDRLFSVTISFQENQLQVLLAGKKVPVSSEDYELLENSKMMKNEISVTIARQLNAAGYSDDDIKVRKKARPYQRTYLSKNRLIRSIRGWAKESYLQNRYSKQFECIYLKNAFNIHLAVVNETTNN